MVMVGIVLANPRPLTEDYMVDDCIHRRSNYCEGSLQRKSAGAALSSACIARPVFGVVGESFGIEKR
jgi:hypothetical protein